MYTLDRQTHTHFLFHQDWNYLYISAFCENTYSLIVSAPHRNPMMIQQTTTRSLPKARFISCIVYIWPTGNSDWGTLTSLQFIHQPAI